MKLRKHFLVLFTLECLVAVVIATELNSLEQNVTCPQISPDFQSSYLQGFKQINIDQESNLLTGCVAPNVENENYVIYIKNNAENKVYLTFLNTEMKATPHNIVLASPSPTTWIIYQLNTSNTIFNYYVYSGSKVINGDTGEKISKATMEETFNPGWYSAQLFSMLKKSIFRSDIKSYIQLERADFLRIDFGAYLVPQDESCKIKSNWKAPSNFISASYLDSILPTSACSLLDTDIKPRVQFLVEINNSRLKPAMLLWLNGVEALNPGSEVVIVLSTTYPVQWEVVTPLNIPLSCNLRFEISTGSSLSDGNIALTDGTTQKISYFKSMPFENKRSQLLVKMSKVHPVQSYVYFNQSVDYVELKIPHSLVKATPKLPSVEEIVLFLDNLKLFCRNKICQLTVPTTIYKACNLLETQIRVGDEDCEIEMNEEQEDFYSDDIEVGSCGLREVHKSYKIKVYLFVGKEIEKVVSTPIPSVPKISVYNDLNRSKKLQFPFLYSTQQESFYVEVSMASTDLSSGINLDQCYLKYAGLNKSSYEYLIYNNCPVNKHVGMLFTYCPDDVHQQVFTFSQDLFSLPNKDYSLVCHVTTCDIDDNLMCQNSDIQSCYGVMDYNHDYNALETEYVLEVGTFKQTQEAPTQTQEPKMLAKNVAISPSMVIFIGFSTFFIGIILVIILWTIHTHYQKKKQTYTNNVKSRGNYASVRTDYELKNQNGFPLDNVKKESRTDQMLSVKQGSKTSGHHLANSKAEEELILPLLNGDTRIPLTQTHPDSSGEGDAGYSSNGKTKSESFSPSRFTLEEQIPYMKEDVV